jgi:hypothetical protein
MADKDIISSIKALQTLIEQNDRRYAMQTAADNRRFDEKFSEAQRALTVALVANDKRLDGMNEFRESLSDTNVRMLTRVEGLAAIQNAHEAILAQIQPLRDKVSAAGKTNFTVLAGYGTAFATLIAGFWLVLGLEISVSISPLSLTVEQIKTADFQRDQISTDQSNRLRAVEASTSQSSQLDMQSKNDRQQLNERMRNVEGSAGTGRVEDRALIAETNQRVVTLQTLFEANREHEGQWITMLYEKSFPGLKFPYSKDSHVP